MARWSDRMARAVTGLKDSLPGQALLRLTVEDFNCLRFANSRGTQTTSIHSLGLELVAALPADGGGARMVTLSSGEFEPEALAARALAALADAPVNAEFTGFAPPGLTYGTVQTSWAATALLDAPAKAATLEAIRRQAPGLWMGGIFDSSSTTRILAGTNGLFLVEESTAYKVEIKYEHEGRTASVYRAGRDIGALDLEEESRRARDEVTASVGRCHLADGTYRLLLAPEAVSEVVFYTSFLGFGGRGAKQGRNFTSKALDGRLFDNPRIRLRDSGRNPANLTRAFDDWGFPRRDLTLIEGGRVADTAHDLFTAPTPEANTGHGDGGSPFPMLMELAPGDLPVAEMTRMEPGTLRVNRFHYPTVADPCIPLLKGSTKDGTFLMTDQGLRDTGGLEFYLDPTAVLGAVVALSRERVTVPQGSLALSLPGANVVPWLLVEGVTATNGVLTLRRPDHRPE